MVDTKEELRLSIELPLVLEELAQKFDQQVEAANPSLRSAVDYLDSIKINPAEDPGTVMERLRDTTSMLEECSDDWKFPQFCAEVCRKMKTDISSKALFSTEGQKLLSDSIELDLWGTKDLWVQKNSLERASLLESCSHSLTMLTKGFILAHALAYKNS